MIANGHVYPQMESVKDGVPCREPLLLFHNTRNGKFEDVTAASGLNTLPLHSRRGLAFGDVNNDGKIQACGTTTRTRFGDLRSIPRMCALLFGAIGKDCNLSSTGRACMSGFGSWPHRGECSS
jgi:hypothetical protein